MRKVVLGLAVVATVGCAAPLTPKAERTLARIEECNQRLPIKITDYRVDPDGRFRVWLHPGMEARFNECLAERGGSLDMYNPKKLP